MKPTRANGENNVWFLDKPPGLQEHKAISLGIGGTPLKGEVWVRLDHVEELVANGVERGRRSAKQERIGEQNLREAGLI